MDKKSLQILISIISIIIILLMSSCKKDSKVVNDSPDIISTDCGDTLIDTRDGQKYPTIGIGSQCWMKVNLNIGQMIHVSEEQTDNNTIEKYCYDNQIAYCEQLGGLYQWDEMMQYEIDNKRGICPEGWHLPDDNEWKNLEVFLGMTDEEVHAENTWRGAQAGFAMKQGGSSGFDVLLAGGRWGNGSFAFLNLSGYYWTATESNGNAWRRCFSANENTIGRYNTYPKSYGFSVRCLKN